MQLNPIALPSTPVDAAPARPEPAAEPGRFARELQRHAASPQADASPADPDPPRAKDKATARLAPGAALPAALGAEAVAWDSGDAATVTTPPAAGDEATDPAAAIPDLTLGFGAWPIAAIVTPPPAAAGAPPNAAGDGNPAGRPVASTAQAAAALSSIGPGTALPGQALPDTGAPMPNSQTAPAVAIAAAGAASLPPAAAAAAAASVESALRVTPQAAANGTGAAPPRAANPGLPPRATNLGTAPLRARDASVGADPLPAVPPDSTPLEQLDTPRANAAAPGTPARASLPRGLVPGPDSGGMPNGLPALPADTPERERGALRGAAAGTADPGITLPAAAPAAASATRQAEAAPSIAEARIAPHVASAEFAPALGAQLSVLVRDGIQQARLQLHPAEMGPISVQIALDGSAARIDFHAGMAATRSAIEASLPALAGALQDAGFTLAGGGVFQQPPQPDPRSAQRDPAADGRHARGDDTPATARGDGLTARPLALQRGLVDLVA